MPVNPDPSTLTYLTPPSVGDTGPWEVASGGTLTVAAPGVLSGATFHPTETWWLDLDSAPGSGTLDYLNTDGSFRYTAPAGPATVTFTIVQTNGTTDTDTGTVTITVLDPEPATVTASSWSVYPGGTLTEDAPGVLTGAARPYGYWAENTTDPTLGTLDWLDTDGSFRYTAGAATGSDTFNIRLSNGTTDSATAVVTINIVAPPSFRPVRSRAGMARVRRNPTRTKIVRPITTSF